MMNWFWFWVKLPIFLLLAPVVWLLTRMIWFRDESALDVWTAFVNWFRGSPPGYRYPRKDAEEIDLRPYQR
jgi:type IV secretory pathway VirB3-like protein